MRISKYLHSCLLFEQDDYQLLVDPGLFSFTEDLVHEQQFANVNAIIVTHKHPDHLDINVLKSITSLSEATVYTNAEVGGLLAAEGLSYQLLQNGLNRIGPFELEVFEVVHEPLLDNPTPQMTAFIVNGKVLHPVDSFEDKLLQHKGIELVLLPVMAPFTTEIKVAAFADQLQPKRILPVHDGFAKPFFVNQRYQNYKQHFDKKGILFHIVDDIGESITVE
ncbi:MBL fold metallo-hydrolase [Mucilaginibacter sp. Bleaf8]|uniref:MBL fold metallo-hydrolase n=1 Tax=Mucilaginibacter sp. Bleaf8 TaxID=2834430 RepID=UPI001BD06A95|nr:MBL fold metallo-hydrolase [Mucilaginibacter sp. Bleaf8]MBS7564643.1 MBL fold metallo-hydrolase [Mucilaginibacter sp. Bleaf8]